MDKKQIANKKLKQRTSYSVMERLPWDQAIHDAVIDSVSPGTIIGVYAAYKSEVDTYGIMESLFFDESITIVVPRILEDRQMEFIKINSFSDLKKNKMGILEPVGHEVLEPSLILVPLLAFNERGYRVGYGGGYYDRYLEAHKAYSIGLAYEFQKTSLQFQEDHDVACDVIITNEGVYYE